MTLTDEHVIKLQRETIDEHISSENDHDWDRVYETFIRDERAFYDVIPFATCFSGFQGVQDFYQAFETAIPDFHIVVSGEYDTPGTSIREVTITGTHRGEFAGVEPKGLPISIELCALYVFGKGDEAGKLLAERIYFDTETLLRQMRGEEGPVGVGLAEREAAK